jgi:hypothetical protein
MLINFTVSNCLDVNSYVRKHGFNLVSVHGF